MLLAIAFATGPSVVNAAGDAGTERFEADPTFHCVGFYWQPAGGGADVACHIRYREAGAGDWHVAQPLYWDAEDHPGAPEHSHEYRGSVVDLLPGTHYEFELALDGQPQAKHVEVSTLDEALPVSRVVKLDPAHAKAPLVISQGGSAADGYVVYTFIGGTGVLDARRESNACVIVNASYVILRGMTLKNPRENGIVLKDVDHVVVEECDISGWGSTDPETNFGVNLQAAIYSESKALSHVIIQRNRLHNPASDANSWEEPRPGTHPKGPQGITLIGSQGHLIIRYNEIYSDEDHRFNDGMGGIHNFSYGGFPYRDSDIYCNQISQCWDDGIEAEGAGMNVRIWGNRISHTFVGFGLATQSLGPCYLFRNVIGFAQRAPYPVAKYNWGGSAIKLGTEKVEFTKGALFIYHNTILQPPSPWDEGAPVAGMMTGINCTGPDKNQSHITSRNNILDTRTFSIHEPRHYPSNDFDYDLYSQDIEARAGSEAHGIRGQPAYAPAARGAAPALAPASPGFDAGAVLPGFNDGYSGSAPDMGAVEAGAPQMPAGTDADWTAFLHAAAQPR